MLLYVQIFLLILSVITQLDALLYPAQATSFSLTSSVSYPVAEYFPERVILIDWCFQMGYDLPATVSSFYNIPIWPGHSPGKVKKREIITQNLKESQNNTHLHLLEKYDRKIDDNRHTMDFSAGELYRGIEDYLVSKGFHETCLLRSVCELAQHPFDDQHRNVLTDIVTFLLTPSLHEGFDATERVYRETYEYAEVRGFLGDNCTDLYIDCEMGFLSIITKVITPND